MPWCPVCKNEYQEGVTVCADCGETLVDALEERKEVFLCKGEEALIRRMQKFLEYSDIPVVFEQEEEEACLYVLPKQERKAKQAVRVFLTESAAEAERNHALDEDVDDGSDAVSDRGEDWTDEADLSRENADAFDGGEDDLLDDTEEGISQQASLDEALTGEKLSARGMLQKSMSASGGGAYRKKSEQADDLKSSGEVLLGFGILGCIAMLLIDFGILPFQFGNRIMMNVIMFALFFFFIGFGVYSLKGARRFRAEASDEDALTERIRAWVKEHLTAECIDEAAGLEEEDADEICFFKRTEAIKEKIAAEFDGVEESYLDSLTETVYQELFD